MQAPTLDRSQADRPINAPARRPRRFTSLLIAATLALLGGAAGVTVALANRPEPAAPAAQPVATTVAPAAAATDQATESAPASDTAAPAAPAAAGQPVVLEDGRHDAFVRKVDTGRGTIVLDVVQVFDDEEAVQAAIEDGKPRAEAQYLSTYVRNQNPRLRTLPLAGDVRVNLRDGCEEPKADQQALLAKLAGNARLEGVYYYTVTVKGGTVRQIDERLAINAC